MQLTILGVLALGLVLSSLCLPGYAEPAAKAAFDPADPIIPTGNKIKIAVVTSFSGRAALVGQICLKSDVSFPN